MDSAQKAEKLIDIYGEVRTMANLARAAWMATGGLNESDVAPIADLLDIIADRLKATADTLDDLTRGGTNV